MLETGDDQLKTLPTRLLCVAVALLAVVAVGCGSSDDGSKGASTTASGPGELTVSDATIAVPANPDTAAVHLDGLDDLALAVDVGHVDRELHAHRVDRLARRDDQRRTKRPRRFL